MSPDIDKWAGNSFPLADWLDDIDPAVDNARLVADRLTSVTVIRGGAAQAAQNVRLEDLRGRSGRASEGGETGHYDMLVLGYKGHATITDTDIQRGDRFVVAGEQFEVVVVTPGLSNQFQAFARVRS